MSKSINYSQIHAYMLQKTQEYYKNPPASLVEAVLEEYRTKGLSLTREQARKLVSPIQIQRLVKQEMTERWPEIMSAIPSNPLRDE